MTRWKCWFTSIKGQGN